MQPLKKLTGSIIKKLTLIARLTSLLRNEFDIEVFKLAIIRFFGQFINMAVMFLPIKIFIMVANSADSSVIDLFGTPVSRETYILVLFSGTSSLYVFNTILSLYSSRKTNAQVETLGRQSFTMMGVNYDSAFIRRIYNNVIGFFSDVVTIVVASIVIAIISLEYLFLFTLILLFQLLFFEYVVHFDKRFSILNSTKIEGHQFISIASNVFYLTLFFLLIVVYVKGSIGVFSAILSLLISRLANKSIKGLVLNQNKILLQSEKYE